MYYGVNIYTSEMNENNRPEDIRGGMEKHYCKVHTLYGRKCNII